MRHVSSKMTENGRLTVPSAIRKQLGLHAGTTVLLEVVDGELRARTVASTMDRARAMSRAMIGDGGGGSAELIAERRREFAMEEAELARAGL